jgi:translation elongation factor P/translation initiation factor 5A
MAGGLHKDCTVKKMPPNADIGSRLIPMQAHDLKNGMWTLDDKTGVPGVVSDLKMSKTGKHGHAKFTYKIRMPHSGRSASLMHPGGDHLLRPVMEKTDYLVSHIDGEEDLVCLDENYEEIYFKLSPDREDVYKQVTETLAKAQEEGKDCMVTVLEGPMKLNEKIDILQIVTEAKMVAAAKGGD